MLQSLIFGTLAIFLGSPAKSTIGCPFPKSYNPTEMNQIILFIRDFVLYLLWFVITIALTITIVGIFVLIMMEDNGWFAIPYELVNRVLNP
jgi:uncharacterized membrane protein